MDRDSYSYIRKKYTSHAEASSAAARLNAKQQLFFSIVIIVS